MDPEPRGMFQLETWESMWFAIPSGMDDADRLADIIRGGGGTVVDETRATQAQYLLLSATLHDLGELCAQANDNGALAIDARWIYASKFAEKLLPWYSYQIRKPDSTKNMDASTRDLRELSIHLARYNLVGPAPDDIYLKLAKKLPHHTSWELKQLHHRHRKNVDACVIDLARQMAAIAPPVDYDFFRGLGNSPNTRQPLSQGPHSSNTTYPLSPSSDSGFPRPPFPFSTSSQTNSGGKVVSPTIISAATMSAASPLYHRKTASRHRQINLGEPHEEEEDGTEEPSSIRSDGIRQDKGKQRADTTNFVRQPTCTAEPVLDSSQLREATYFQEEPETTASVAAMATTAAASSSLIPKEEETEPVLPPAGINGASFAPVPPTDNENDMPRRRSGRGQGVGRGRWVWAEIEGGTLTDWIWVADLGEGISISDIQYL